MLVVRRAYINSQYICYQISKSIKVDKKVYIDYHFNKESVISIDSFNIVQ